MISALENLLHKARTDAGIGSEPPEEEVDAVIETAAVEGDSTATEAAGLIEEDLDTASSQAHLEPVGEEVAGMRGDLPPALSFQAADLRPLLEEYAVTISAKTTEMVDIRMGERDDMVMANLVGKMSDLEGKLDVLIQQTAGLAELASFPRSMKAFTTMMERKPGNLSADRPALTREMMLLLSIGGLVPQDYKPSRAEEKAVIERTIAVLGRGKIFTVNKRLAAVLVVAVLIGAAAAVRFIGVG